MTEQLLLQEMDSTSQVQILVKVVCILIDFNSISTFLEVFYIKRLKNHIHYTFLCK